VQQKLLQLGITPVSTLCLPDITAHNQIAQAFPLRICTLQVIGTGLQVKDWR